MPQIKSVHWNFDNSANKNDDWTKSLRDGLRRLWRSFLFNLKKVVDNES